jgi:hypothetical protein
MVIILTPGKLTHVQVFGQATGAIGATTVRSPHPITCTWTSTGTAIAEHADLSAKHNLTAGKYRLTVNDEYEGAASVTYIITENRPLRIYPAAVSDIDVFGAHTGSIGRTSVSGGSGSYTPYWSSDVLGMTSDHSLQPKMDLAAGLYTVRVIGGEAEYTYQVSQSKEMRIHKGVVRNATLNGLTGGYISTSKILGGVPPYTVEWSRRTASGNVPIEIELLESPEPNQTIMTTRRDLRPGMYALQAVDSVGAVVTAEFKVREGPNKQYFEFAGTRNFYSTSS